MSVRISSQTYRFGQRLEIRHGDLTNEEVDAIINAANSSLEHGGGIAGAIVRKGGSQIQVESDDWVKRQGRVSHTAPAYTSAGCLPCEYILHAVGPIWGDGDKDKKLSLAISGCLTLANELLLTSIAFPAISTGIFGFPKERAARIFFQTISDYFDQEKINSVKIVSLVLYDEPTLFAFLKVFESWKIEQIDKGKS